jgi:hypothetical protein
VIQGKGKESSRLRYVNLFRMHLFLVFVLSKLSILVGVMDVVRVAPFC